MNKENLKNLTSKPAKTDSSKLTVKEILTTLTKMVKPLKYADGFGKDLHNAISAIASKYLTSLNLECRIFGVEDKSDSCYPFAKVRIFDYSPAFLGNNKENNHYQDKADNDIVFDVCYDFIDINKDLTLDDFRAKMKIRLEELSINNISHLPTKNAKLVFYKSKMINSLISKLDWRLVLPAKNIEIKEGLYYNCFLRQMLHYNGFVAIKVEKTNQ